MSLLPRAAAFVSALALFAPAAQADLKVVASIKPIHSIASSVMAGVGTPSVLIGGAASPHSYALRPSQARALQEADVVFWAGPDLEAFLEKPLASLSANAHQTPLMESEGLTLLPFREGGGFQAHDHSDHADGDHGHKDHDHDKHGHEDHGHEDHGQDDHGQDDHGHDDHGHDDHGHDDHGHDDHGHDKHGHEGHAHDGMDPHIWLDPVNGQRLALAMAEVLAESDPANAARYRENAERFTADIDVLTAHLTADLAPVRGTRFIVFHDAYQYFENRFGLTSAGSITISPEVVPGAARVGEIRDRIADDKAACVFSEPQFEPRLVQVVTEGTTARTAVLDPLGAEFEAGPAMYRALLEAMAASFRDCLS
ncbi:MAG: zinc ABC transporter substrate-binding protein [Alphaproteobacteria bacterium]|nr:zinc ABC transporter substrate-binding protein [Alphaproteobacteria bacterium]